ncbi:ATP-binding protein [Zavarzinia sp. CC-PAN008]|uniref:sensor histidine kinase NtrY-like n=1 Tax=Zavarzinia sp. CC-PAN008 TaxID=3243332 RepID=UPI003F7447D9
MIEQASNLAGDPAGPDAAPNPQPTWSRFADWAHRVGLGGKLAIGVVILALAAGLATYVALTGTSLFLADQRAIVVLLLLDLVLILALASIVVGRLIRLWVARRTGSAGARLHVRMAALFSIVAVLPTVVVAVASAAFFNLGVQAWFSERVQNALSSSVAVAHAYVEEHRKTIQADILAMATDLERQAMLLDNNPAALNRLLDAQVAARNLAEAVILDSSGRVVARSSLSFSMAFERVPMQALERARAGEVVTLTNEEDDRVRALSRLDRFLDAYLFVGRFVDPRVIGHVERTQAAADEYQRLEDRRSEFQITFAIIFIVVAVLVLLAAVLAGLWLATRIVTPIGALAAAAERVRTGDLSARVEEGATDDEIGTLARAFNRMTTQLDGQRRELVEANHQLDRRRRFMETVLSGVTAGVLGVDEDGRITLPNRSATQLLDVPPEALIGHPFQEAVPEMAGLMADAMERGERMVQGQVMVNRGARPRTLVARVVRERTGTEARGYVVTFDDISDLVAAQRMAAWADVARRIAHEIKNPLTPIQLSAERLKRKYMREISTDPEIFSQCTETIIRQVGDIGRMVDEFSAFARMPSPVFKGENMADLARQASFLIAFGQSDIVLETDFPSRPVNLRCDGRQVIQAVGNLLKNAVEAIEGREPRGGEDAPPQGHIVLRVREAEDAVVIEVSDNGRGLPSEQRDRLMEPYVTTRTKGTGLGLAIAKKVMEEHGGEISLDDSPGGGAVARLSFPRAVADAAPATSASGSGAPAVPGPASAMTLGTEVAVKRVQAHGA